MKSDCFLQLKFRKTVSLDLWLFILYVGLKTGAAPTFIGGAHILSSIQLLKQEATPFYLGSLGF